MQKATFRIVKGGLLHYELHPFVCQEMALLSIKVPLFSCQIFIFSLFFCRFMCYQMPYLCYPAVVLYPRKCISDIYVLRGFMAHMLTFCTSVPVWFSLR